MGHTPTPQQTVILQFTSTTLPQFLYTITCLTPFALQKEIFAKFDVLLASQLDVLDHGVSVRTGWPGINIVCVSEIVTLICKLQYFSSFHPPFLCSKTSSTTERNCWYVDWFLKSVIDYGYIICLLCGCALHLHLVCIFVSTFVHFVLFCFVVCISGLSTWLTRSDALVQVSLILFSL